MSKRINIMKQAPEAYKAMMGVERYLDHTGINPVHRELIKIRASQINGCAYCINMHTKDARKAGETEQRIYSLNAWREAPWFTEEERAILALTEQVTMITGRVSDEVYNAAAALFDEQYLGHVIMTIVAINAWNRVAVSTHLQPEVLTAG